jgi:hypothetical protein
MCIHLVGTCIEMVRTSEHPAAPEVLKLAVATREALSPWNKAWASSPRLAGLRQQTTACYAKLRGTRTVEAYVAEALDSLLFSLTTCFTHEDAAIQLQASHYILLRAAAFTGWSWRRQDAFRKARSRVMDEAYCGINVRAAA